MATPLRCGVPTRPRPPRLTQRDNCRFVTFPWDDSVVSIQFQAVPFIASPRGQPRRAATGAHASLR